ncbi:MAG TPA: hypothetical protein PKI19_07610, partial [Elusimicrobiales bacterium]|nr:hypothetical protein [Elusimicrobiales bacterium]
MEKSGMDKINAEVDALFRNGRQPPLNSRSAAVQARPAAPEVLKPGQQGGPALKTVLVVDDNKDYRELVRHLLTVHHYRVMEAGNGVEALAVIEKE